MLTYFDVVEHLITASFGGPQDAEQRDIRTAVQRAYDEVISIKDWAYYHVHGRVLTSAPYSTGTVITAGTTVTLTGGTWPTWAATGGFLRIGNEICRVATRNSNGTEIVLDSTLSLKASFPTAQVYTLYRTVYALPSDFRNLDEPSDEYNWWAGRYITPNEAMKLQRTANQSGKPYNWTILKDPDSDGWALELIGYPSTVETIDFISRRSPRQIRLSGHEANSRVGTITSASLAVTGVTTAFAASMVGSVMRAGTTADFPQTLAGLKPYEAESLITARSSTTVLTTGVALSAAAGTKYLITDPIDAPVSMHAAILSAAEYWLARLRGVKPDNAFAMYQRDLKVAMERDQVAPLSGRSAATWNDGGWRSPLGTDRGTT